MSSKIFISFSSDATAENCLLDGSKSEKKKSAIDFDFNLWDKQITVPFSGFGSHMNMNKCANNFPKIQLQKSFACHRNSFGFQNRIPKEQTI